MTNSELGQIIQKRRQKLLITQESLAELSGMSSRTIHLIETGRGNPSFENLQKICSVLGLDVNIAIKKTDE